MAIQPLRTPLRPVLGSRREWASVVAGYGFGIAIVAMVCLQVVSLDVRNPFVDTLSSYAYASEGWLFGLSLISIAVGTAALVVMSGAPQIESGRGMRSMLAVASLASLGAALFPADPRGHTAVGEAHRYFSIVLLVAIPFAALAMVRRGLGGLLGPERRRSLVRLIVASAVAGSLFLFSQLLKWSDVPEKASADAALFGGGVIQRIQVGVVFALLLIMCAELRRIRGNAGSSA